MYICEFRFPMNLTVNGFDWDLGNREKCVQHDVSIAEIEAVFRDGPEIAPDLKHSDAEMRYIAIGRGNQDRPIFIAFTFRKIEGALLIRPVSARYMHAKEAARYDANHS